MGPTVRLRSRTAQSLGAAMVLVSVAGLVSVGLDGADTLLRYGSPLLLFGTLGWGAFWQPYVEVSDGGVTVANTLRTLHVPWPAVQDVDGRYGLRLGTAYGRVTAWAAPAPAGRQRARGQDGQAAQIVHQRLEALREAGHLDDARIERPEPMVTWHRPLIAAVAVLAVASVVLPFAV